MKGKTGGAWSLDSHKIQNHRFNNGLAEFVYNEFKPKSVLEFGCGIGWYCDYFSSNGASIVHGIEPELMDENYFKNEGCKQFCFDVTQDDEPEDMLDQYDMIFSLEVLEHIPRKYHEKVFDFLASKKPKIVVFSAARVGQGGHGHIACRPEEEWIQEWKSRGYVRNEELTNKVRESSNRRNINHIKNVNVYTL